MGSKKTGTRSQLTGERAETKVRNVLLDASLFCSKYEHDRGEDLLVELEGYIAQADDSGTGPRIGLLQIKGHEVEEVAASDESEVRLRLDLNHIRRWAAIPLPVFVVVVQIVRNVPLFFSRSVDRLVEDVAPGGLAVLEQQSVTVSLPSVADLADFLKTEIAEFYSLHAFQLSGLSENVVARNHYEIISAATPFVLPSAKVWEKKIRVLWKGPWRPAHFWATLNRIADQLREKDGGRQVPLMATVHVYRSLKDARDNNAIAHVSWLEDNHGATERLRELVNWPRAAHWARFRFHGRFALDSLSESFAPEEADEDFIVKAEALWAKLDEIYLEVVSCLTQDLRLSEDKRIGLEQALLDLEKRSLSKLGRPSPQLSVLYRMIDQYSSALSNVFFWLKGKKDVPEVTRQRWLRDGLQFAEGHHCAYYPLAKLLLSQ